MSDEFMDIAIEEASEGLQKREGGPFGAVIVKDGEIIARAHNMVLQHNDPTAHAEVTCIRKACAKLGTFNLKGCEIYSTCQPCPMCFGAIHWANLDKCCYGCRDVDAEKGGFSDKKIYQAIRGEVEGDIEFIFKENEGCRKLFGEEYGLY